MTQELRERATYVKAIEIARARLGEADAQLAAAPADARNSPEQRSLHGAAQADLAGLLALQYALDEFDAGPIRDDDAYDALGLLLNAIGSGEELLEALRPDARRRFGDSPAMDPDRAKEIVAGWQDFGAGLGSMPQFMDDLGLPAEDRADLLNTGRRHWEAENEPLADGQRVGVLLPLRLETRFAPPDGGFSTWRLKLRIYPEEAAFDRHPGPPTEAEAKHTKAMWQACDGKLGTPEGTAAFGDLAGRVGGARAAWLARALPVSRSMDGRLDVEPPEMRSEDRRVFQAPTGLPPRLEVWIGRGGNDPVIAEVVDLDRQAIVDQVDLDAIYAQLRDPSDPGTLLDPDAPPPETWWNSFQVAKDVGLGVEIGLGGAVPDDIDVIYVVGLSEEDVGPMFRRHAEAGRLGVLPPGAATNSVAGDPTIDLGRDLDAWWRLAMSTGLASAATAELDLALCRGEHLGPLPGPDVDLRGIADALVSALFPPLFGRALKDVWPGGTSAWDVGRWARRCLAPEGPLPAIRIGDQPYGVLPVSALGRWNVYGTEPEIEMALLLEALVPILRQIAEAAEAEGNASGADTERLLELLGRTPVPDAWDWRLVLPVSLLQSLISGLTGLLSELEGTWRKGVSGAYDAGLSSPLRRYIPFGDGRPLESALLRTPVSDSIRRLLESTNADLVSTPDTRWHADGPAPLLARLVRHSLVFTNAELARLFSANPPNRPELLTPIFQPWELADLARVDVRDDPDFAGDEYLPDTQYEIDTPDSDIVVRNPHPFMERVARSWEAVRDGATVLAAGTFDDTRLQQALAALLDSAARRVDPWVTGLAWRRLRWLQARDVPWSLGAYGWVDAPGPADREELRPGPTAAGFLHAPSPQQALTAAILRDHAVRETDVARWDLTLDSAKVRAAARLAAEVKTGVHVKEALGRMVEGLAGDPGVVHELRDDPRFMMRPEHQGRRVCDGEAVVAAAHDDPASLPDGLPIGEVAALRDVLDTYGDLLVADAVGDVVGGRADRAAEAMEAAAGLGPPSDLRMLRTPREGVALSTAVVAVLPARAPAAPKPPGALADPVLARLLEDRHGDPSGPNWTWGVGSRSVSLAAVGLTPIDVLTVPAGALADRLRRHVSAPDTAELREPAGAVAARELAALLGTPRGLAEAILGVGEAGAILEVLASLRQRLKVLAPAAGELADRLQHSPAAADLLLAESWALQPSGETVSQRAAAAAAALRERIERERQAALGDASLPPTYDAVAGLIQRIRSLLGTDLPVVPEVPRTALDVVVADGGRLRDGHVRLDETWLEPVAPVRPPLARLEAWQLGHRDDAWTSWSTHAADVWRKGWLAGRGDARDAHEQVIAYGPPAAFAEDKVGLVLLDRFSETVPSATHVTSAAFGFNGPKARAPQAILLAVPPDPGARLETDALVETLADARRLARARMATTDTLHQLRVVLPSPLLLGWGGEERYANVDVEHVR